MLTSTSCRKSIYMCILNSMCLCIWVNESLPTCLQTSILAPTTSECFKNENQIFPQNKNPPPLSPQLRISNGLSCVHHEIELPT